MPSASKIIGYRVQAYDASTGDWVQGVECNARGMIPSLRLALEWERQGYVVEHEAIEAEPDRSPPCPHSKSSLPSS